MNRRAFLVALPAAPLAIASWAVAAPLAAGFTDPVRWTTREHSSSLLIAELSRVWDSSPQGIREEWGTSPDLRAEPYGIPADAVAVRLTLKAKVLCHTWSSYHCDGTIGVAVRMPGGTEPVNFAGHTRESKRSGSGNFTAEKCHYSTAEVRVVDGRFDIFTSISIKNHVLVSIDAFLAGYAIP